jgi:hypothetical protein
MRQGLALTVRSPVNLRDLPRWIASWRFDSALAAGLPWLPFPAVRYLAARLPPDARVFEYGAGGSTLWLAERAALVVSVEHSAAWHGRIAGALAARGINTCDLRLRPPRPANFTRVIPVWDGDADVFADYVAVIDAFPDGFFDLVVVDGRSRPACLGQAVPKVRPGGMLALDDADRPEYALALTALPPWPRRDFRGLRPGRRSEPTLTSIWTRPPEPE